jgi:hypothetical protein
MEVEGSLPYLQQPVTFRTRIDTHTHTHTHTRYAIELQMGFTQW